MLPSFKFGVYARSQITVSSSGNGFAIVDPWAPFSDSSSNSCPFLRVTAYGTIGTSSTLLENFVSTVDVDPQSPISYAAFDPTSDNSGRLRCVGCAVRVSDMTATLYSQGKIILFRDPSNGKVGTRSLDQLQVMPETEYSSISKGEYYTCLWKPLSPEALAYQYAPGTGGPDAKAQFGIGVLAGSTVSGSEQTFEVEVVGFYEAVGSPTGEHSVSHSDPVGISKTLEVVSAVGYTSKSRRAPHRHARGVWDSIKGAIADGASGFIHAGAAAATEAIRLAPGALAKAVLNT